MLKLLIDENLDQRILRGLQLRVPGLLYTLVQETALAGSQDAPLLQWAADNQRALVTHDRKTMLKAVYQRLRSGQKTAGLVIVRKELPLIRAIEDLVLLLECCTEIDLENQVVFIPL
jgi:predicted nuclease of predicted toxin-antitoxin system